MDDVSREDSVRKELTNDPDAIREYDPVIDGPVQLRYVLRKECNPSDFITKDSGKRLTFESGMQRDVTEGKIDYTMCLSGPMLDRWAALLMRGAQKYDRDNWMKAEGEAELMRFRESALRHMIQWLRGENDEDHAAAIFFNVSGAEYVKGKMEARADS